jgi:hypothetical protein
LRFPSLVRIFAVYMALRYIGLFYLEPKIMLHTELTTRGSLFLPALGGMQRALERAPE